MLQSNMIGHAMWNRCKLRLEAFVTGGGGGQDRVCYEHSEACAAFEDGLGMQELAVESVISAWVCGERRAEDGNEVMIWHMIFNFIIFSS